MQIGPVVPTALSPRYTTSEPVLDMLMFGFRVDSKVMTVLCLLVVVVSMTSSICRNSRVDVRICSLSFEGGFRSVGSWAIETF